MTDIDIYFRYRLCYRVSLCCLGNKVNSQLVHIFRVASVTMEPPVRCPIASWPCCVRRSALQLVNIASLHFGFTLRSSWTRLRFVVTSRCSRSSCRLRFVLRGIPIDIISGARCYKNICGTFWYNYCVYMDIWFVCDIYDVGCDITVCLQCELLNNWKYHTGSEILVCEIWHWI